MKGSNLAAIRSGGRQNRVTLPGAARVELRVEAFNLFNRVNFQIPNSNRSLSNFGTITATYNPRQYSLG